MNTNIYDIIDELNLDVGETKRITCPSCHGYKTFTVTNNMGKILWNCYKSSCKISGAKKIRVTIEDIKKKMMPQNEHKEDIFDLPEQVVFGGMRFEIKRFAYEYGIDFTKPSFLNGQFYNDANGASCGNWKFQGSNDNSSYTDLSASFEWVTAGDSAPFTKEVSWSNDTAYRYLRLLGLTGAQTNNNPWQTELEFKIKTTTPSATGSFEGVAITAGASTSSMGAVITYQDHAGTNTLNTDIVLQLSADNGSNFTTATLTALPDFATGIKMAKVNDLSVTSGTQLKYKILFANQSSGSKEARIRGLSLQY